MLTDLPRFKAAKIDNMKQRNNTVCQFVEARVAMKRRRRAWFRCVNINPFLHGADDLPTDPKPWSKHELVRFFFFGLSECRGHT